MIKSATAAFLGEAQIHRKNFRTTQAVEKTINNLESVVESLKKEEVVDKFTLRTVSFGMITSPANVSAIVLYGIEPETERYLSRVDDAIKQGEFFKEGDERDVVIGSKLAEVLEASLGDRVVITVSQAKTGDLSQEMFRISGIYRFNVKEMDDGMAFVLLKKAQKMLALGSNVHEIAIKFKKLEYASQKDLPFWDKYSKDDNEIASWTALLPQLKAVFGLTKFSLLFVGIILFGVVVFGIINTMFMSIYERMFEFGVLRAVGTRPSGILRLIVLEAGALAVLSNFLGSAMGFILTYIVTKTGIDYRGIEFAGTAFYDLIYPVLQMRQFIIYPVVVFFFTLAVGLYPALYAARMSITGAMRKSL
jgi:ABC-type lipoprotein release transport system permease subunit